MGVFKRLAGIWPVVFLLICAGPAGLAAQDQPEAAGEEPAEKESYTLALQLPAGRWLMTQEHTSESSTSIDADEVPAQNIQMQTGVLLDVKDLEDGGKRIDLEVRSLAMTVTVHTVKMQFDSRASRGQSPLLAQLVGPLVGAKGTLILGPDGKVAQSAFAQDLWKQVAASKPQLAEMLDDLESLSTSRLTGMSVEGFAAMLPGKPVEVGQEWSAKSWTDTSPLGRLQVLYQCKLDEVRETPAGRVARVIFEAPVTADQAQAKMKMGQSQIVLDNFSSRQKGDLSIYLESGLLAGYDISQEAKSLMRVTDRLNKTRQVSVVRKSRTHLEIQAAPGGAEPDSEQP
jgi:hypothetical protein